MTVEEAGGGACLFAKMKKVGNIEREETLFFEALGQSDPVKRSVFLGRACAGEPALRARVEKLLAVQTEAERFLPRPNVQPISR